MRTSSGRLAVCSTLTLIHRAGLQGSEIAVVTVHVDAPVRHDDERHVCDKERSVALDDERHQGHVGAQRALPPSELSEVVVAENDYLPPGEVHAGRLPATKDVATAADVTGAHDSVAGPGGLPPAVPERPVHRTSR